MTSELRGGAAAPEGRSCQPRRGRDAPSTDSGQALVTAGGAPALHPAAIPLKKGRAEARPKTTRRNTFQYNRVQQDKLVFNVRSRPIASIAARCLTSMQSPAYAV